MSGSWEDRKNILCIRLDNMGDLLMSSAAIQALKETFRCKITVLTSSMAGGIAKHMPCIDEVIVANVPWVKTENHEGAAGYVQLVERIRRMNFDAAVVFTVFSQNPLPAVLLAYLAGIKYRLAYCRENPYDLLTHWVPDQEPYSLVSHQVERDLNLVMSVGAKRSTEQRLCLTVPNNAYGGMMQKITDTGIKIERPWIIVHPGASEAKRLYPTEKFNDILKRVCSPGDIQVLITGSQKEIPLAEELRSGISDCAFSAAGLLSLEEFMAAIDIAPLVLSVNTGTVHIAAALNTPVVVLYAATNPQHTPWNVPNKVFLFPVSEKLQSRNQVLTYVTKYVMDKCDHFPDHDEVIRSIKTLMRTAHKLPA